MSKKSKPKILIVDDQPINIKLLQSKLVWQGIEVFVAHDGHECLGIVEKTKPELVLLDVMMPEVDGIETCQHLKVRPETATIPIIFITKPINLDEALARVRTKLRLQEMFRKNMELQERLGDMRKSAAVGAITRGIAHNLNNLFDGGYLDLIRALGFVKTSLTRFSDHLLQQKPRSVGEWGSPPPATQHAIFPEICG